MRVLICEPNVPGHHLHYASMTARAVRNVTSDVVLALSREALGTYWYQHFVQPLEHSVTIRADHKGPLRRSESSVSARVRNRLAHWAFLERYILELRPDHVILPSGDRVINTLSLLPKAFSRGAEIEVVLHTSVLGNRPAHETLETRVRRMLIPRAPAVTRFHFTDWTQYDEARQRWPTLARKFRLLPNPMEVFDLMARDEARRVLDLPLQTRIAVVLSPEPIKGLGPLLDLFASRKAPQDCLLLIAGRIHPSIENDVNVRLRDQRREGRVLLLKDATDEIDLHRAISAADLVIGRLTPIEGISAMCLRAAVAGRRFFAASSPWIEMMARDLGLGDCFTMSGPEAFATQFRRALDRSREPIDSEVVRRIRQFHSAEHFSEAISDRLRTRSGSMLSPGLSWDWIREAADRPARSSIVA